MYIFTAGLAVYITLLFVLQDLELVVHIHNRACSELLKIITDETLNKCTIGAPEFVRYALPSKMNECSSMKLYEIMPPYFGSTEYRYSLVKVWLN